MTVSTMIGVAIGGIIYIRWGMFRSLLIFGIGQALTNLLYLWLALAGKKIWLLVLTTSLDTGIGGMGQAAFVAFLVSQCSPNYSATQYALLSALASVPRVVMGAIAGQVVAAVGWANFFVVTFLSAIPGLIRADVIPPAHQRTRGARSRETLTGAARKRKGGSAAQRTIVRSGPKTARIVLELAVQVFGLYIHRARPILRRIRRIDEFVEQLFVPGIEFHFRDGAIEVLNFNGLILVVNRDHFK